MCEKSLLDGRGTPVESHKYAYTSSKNHAQLCKMYKEIMYKLLEIQKTIIFVSFEL